MGSTTTERTTGPAAVTSASATTHPARQPSTPATSGAEGAEGRRTDPASRPGPVHTGPYDRRRTPGAPLARHLITSALPYINGVKHLGNLVGSMLPADVAARALRAQGHEVLAICATDEPTLRPLRGDQSAACHFPVAPGDAA